MTTVLVTGASSGIGLATAELLERNGRNVYGTIRNRSTFQTPPLFHLVELNVQESIDSLRKHIDDIVEKTGSLDVLVNNAGYSIAGPVEEIPLEETMNLFDVNYHAIERLCQIVIPQMKKQRQGKIINIGSLAGEWGQPFQATYSASKAAVRTWSQAVRAELIPWNIYLSLIEPGNAYTSFTKNRKIISEGDNPSFRRALEIIERDETGGILPGKIASLVEQIIKTSKPKAIYKIGHFHERLAIALQPVFTRAYEVLLDRHYKISK